MPTYDYQCNACSHPYTAMHKISESAPACPSCGSADIRKLLSAPAIHGKGSTYSPEPPCASPAFQGGCGSGMCGHKH